MQGETADDGEKGPTGMQGALGRVGPTGIAGLLIRLRRPITTTQALRRCTSCSALPSLGCGSCTSVRIGLYRDARLMLRSNDAEE